MISETAFLPALIGAGVLSICAACCRTMCNLAVPRVRTHTRALPTRLVSGTVYFDDVSVLSFIKDLLY